jgi:hypothetical protein
MSLEHSPRRKERRLLSNWSSLDAPLAPSHPNQVLLFSEWCQFNRFSERTGRRIIATGNEPKLTRLSSRRFGITVGNNALWQQGRERDSPRRLAAAGEARTIEGACRSATAGQVQSR